MYPLNPYIVEKIVRIRQEELEREASWNRLAHECNQDVKGMKAGRLKYRLLALIGVLSALMWFLT